MIDDKPISDDNLKMQELCVHLHVLKQNRDNAKLNKINADITIIDLSSLISATIQEINLLQNKGIKLLDADKIKELIAQRQQPQGMR